MKKCPRCNSISLDSDNSCGVCGASLSAITSQRLEQLAHRQSEVRSKRKFNSTGVALITVALTMTIVGASLLFFDALGIFLLLTGLIMIVYILGGAGAGLGGSGGLRRGGGKISMQEEEAKKDEEERRRRRGEGD